MAAGALGVRTTCVPVQREDGIVKVRMDSMMYAKERSYAFILFVLFYGVAADVAAREAMVRQYPEYVDVQAGDRRLSPYSEFVDAGPSYTDIGVAEVDLVIMFSQFLDVTLCVGEHDTVRVSNGAMCANTLGPQRIRLDEALVENLRPVYVVTAKSGVWGASCRVGISRRQGADIPCALPSSYEMLRVTFNGITRAIAPLSQLPAGGSIAWIPFVPDGTAPAPVQGLSASSSAGGVTLSWRANHEPDLKRYAVYRIPAHSPHLARQIASVTCTTFTDSAGDLSQHAYKVIAYDSTGNLSEPVYAVRWAQHRQVVLNTSATGANVSQSVADFPVLVRLRDTNFDFSQAASRGGDLRFAGATGHPLRFEIELWDSTAALADIWVLVDTVRGNDSAQSITMYWGNAYVGDASNGVRVFDTDNRFMDAWHLAEDSSGRGGAAVYRDASRSAFHGTDSVSASGKAGIVGRGQQFDKESGDIVVFAGRPDTLGALTLSAWVNLDTIYPSWQTSNPKRENHIFGNWCWWPSSGYQLALLSDQLVAILNVPGNKWHYAESVITAPHTWFHVAMTWDSTGCLKFYRNGECVSQQSTAAGVIATTGDTPLRISASGATAGMDGFIDEVRSERTVRSPSWLKLCYENQKANQTLVNVAPQPSAAIAYDGFAYTAGHPLHAMGASGDGWAGPWQNVRSIEWHKAVVEQPGGVYGNLQVSGNGVVVDNTTAHHYRALATRVGGTPGQDIWLSYLMGDNDNGSHGAWNAFAPISSAYGYDSDPRSFSNRLFSIQITGSDATRSWRIQKHYANNAWLSPNLDHYGAGSVPWTPGYHFVVVKIQVQSTVSNVYVWIDPQDVHSLGPAHLSLMGNQNGPVLFDGVRWHAEPFHGDRTARLDELRIGLSLGSVTPGL